MNNYIVTYAVIGLLVMVVVSLKEKQWELGLVAGIFWPITLLVLLVHFISDRF